MAYDPDFIPRFPDPLMASALPDWCKLIWLAIRKVQGANVWAFAHFGTYAEMCGKHPTQGSQAIKILVEHGWLERDGKRVRCLIPTSASVDGSSTVVDGSSTQEVDGSSTRVDGSSTRVDGSSTATESGQRIQSKNPREDARGASPPPFREVEDWWNELAERHGLPSVLRLTAKRKAAVRQRWEEIWPRRDELAAAIAASPFLRGANDRGWRCDFDFVWLRRDGWVKMLEGHYAGSERKNGAAVSAPQLGEWST